MKLYRTRAGTVVEVDGQFHPLGMLDWDTFINRDDLHDHLAECASRAAPTRAAQEAVSTELLAPIGTQVVWSAGATYLRSRDARADESRQSGGADFYTRVYEAERPELFFKANAHQVARPGGAVRLRRDSHWNVPEPEFTLFISRRRRSPQIPASRSASCGVAPNASDFTLQPQDEIRITIPPIGTLFNYVGT
jgi:2-dehydro-3-deoxy-D-arabinonate dehydratase